MPELRAQAIQVLHSCAALARRGHEVTVFAQTAQGFAGDETEALACYGLRPHPGLRVEILPFRHPGLAGLEFRRRALAWLFRRAKRARGEPPVIYARTKRHADQALSLRRLWDFTLVFESHEAESAQLREQGRAHGALERLERRVFAGADGLVTNCEGTLEVLRRAHGSGLPRRCQVIHNGCDPSRLRPGIPHEGLVAGYVGSLRGYKNIRTLLAAARLLAPGLRLRLVGGTPGEAEFEDVRRGAGGLVELRPAVPYHQVPEVLAGLDVLVLSLGDDLYGRQLASPLKLWDYLATGLPVVAPDLPSVRRICGDAFFAYRPGDERSVALAIQEAAGRGRGEPRLRSWDQRAEELERFLRSLP